MPLRKPERLATIIRVRVVNPKAPQAGETGWIVDTGETPSLQWVDVQFDASGRTYRYERGEVELVI